VLSCEELMFALPSVVFSYHAVKSRAGRPRFSLRGASWPGWGMSRGCVVGVGCAQHAAAATAALRFAQACRPVKVVLALRSVDL